MDGRKFESEFGEKEPAVEEMIDQMKEWKDSFDGGMVLSMGGFEKMVGMLSDGTEFKDMPPPTVVFLIETEKTDKDLVQTLRWMKKEIKRRTETSSGTVRPLKKRRFIGSGQTKGNTMRRRPFS